MGRRSYSDDFKAEVMAALLAGQSVTDVSKEYEVPRGTVAGWSSKLNEAGVPTVSNTKKEEFGERLLQLANTIIDAQLSMLQVMAEKDYLRQQDLAQLATAMGITNDKLDRLMMRFSNASADNTPES